MVWWQHCKAWKIFAHCFEANTGFAVLIQFLWIWFIWWLDISSWADFKRVNRHIPSFYICDKMFMLVHLLSIGIFDICFQWDSKLKNIHLFLHSIIITRSGFSAITRRFTEKRVTVFMAKELCSLLAEEFVAWLSFIADWLYLNWYNSGRSFKSTAFTTYIRQELHQLFFKQAALFTVTWLQTMFGLH